MVIYQQLWKQSKRSMDYLAKPADADDVEAALLAPTDSKARAPENPMSADRVKWEHIIGFLNYTQQKCFGNSQKT